MIARWLVIGFLVSLGVTETYRFLDAAFVREHVQLFFMLGPPLMFLVTAVLLGVLKVHVGDRGEAAAIFAVPGMLVGIYAIANYAALFPNLDADFRQSYAALLFAEFAAIIAAGLLFSRFRVVEKDV